MEKKLIREVRILKVYAFGLTAIMVWLLLLSFNRNTERQHFGEIDVERINVVEKDGRLKMVISNSERQHPGMADGHMMPARKRSAGMIFFNSAGDECGGLIYDATPDEAGMVLSTDQYKNDQIMQLQYAQDMQHPGHPRAYGLRLWDRPDDFTLARQTIVMDSLNGLHDESLKERALEKMAAAGKWGTERMFAGRQKNGEVGLFIRDDKGRVRIRIAVGRNNQPEITLLDEKGNPASG